ncbi:LysR family transcriptional regulator [Solimicrobium silvestre]|uniref:LysR substrate binding domain n=1 Tax=Solimicrobium silvestre TaxID=2099400 RepID=A0A2S9H580_9BURK|nr:LysR family transcriptional regulator [Solimicrobium silvestre]PRC95026.1 LysR substrate binding domain [Solimicrobium silvestre]
MHISRIDLNLFVVFEAIYSEGSITRAAKTMNLSQPALSHALGRLRELLNDPLFQRLGSNMVPTPLAHSLIGQIRTALQTLDVSVNNSRRFDPLLSSRQFTLGFRDVLESTALPKLINALQTSAPQVELASVKVERSELESELMAGSLDLAVDVLLPFPAPIRRRLISRDSMVVVARNNHPGIKKKLTLANYLKQNHVLVSSRRTGPGLEDLELSRQGHQRHIGLRCQHYFAASLVVSESDLLLTMPGKYAQLANKHLDNQIWPLPLKMPPFDVYLYWHENAENDPANCWLRELVMQCFGGIS